jgi:hypothetical protein
MLGVHSKEKRTAAVSGKNRYFDAAQDAGGVMKKALGRMALPFRMIPTGWTRDWNRFLGTIRNFTDF